MTVNIGKYRFVSQEALDSLLKAHIIGDYDLSPELRDKHEEESIYRDNIKIKLTQEERWQYTKDYLETPQKTEKQVTKEDKIVNPWMDLE